MTSAVMLISVRLLSHFCCCLWFYFAFRVHTLGRRKPPGCSCVPGKEQTKSWGGTQFSNTCISGLLSPSNLQMTSQPWLTRELQPREKSCLDRVKDLMPGFLTHGDCEMMNVSHSKPFGLWCVVLQQVHNGYNECAGISASTLSHSQYRCE